MYWYYSFVIFLKIDKMCLEKKLFHLSRSTAFPAIKHVCPPKIQISMCIQADQCLRCPPGDALDSWLPKVCPAKTLARLRRCTDLFKSSLGAQSDRKCCASAHSLFYVLIFHPYCGLLKNTKLSPNVDYQSLK